MMRGAAWSAGDNRGSHFIFLINLKTHDARIILRNMMEGTVVASARRWGFKVQDWPRFAAAN
jgi:hypothetical protein